MASSLDNPLIQNNMLGARDATVLLLGQQPLHSAHCAGCLLYGVPACVSLPSHCHFPVFIRKIQHHCLALAMSEPLHCTGSDVYQ